MADVDTAVVRGAGTDDRVVIWDVDPDHPNDEGEVLIANDGVGHKVALNAVMQKLLADGKLVKVSAARADFTGKEAEEADRKAENRPAK